jgi:hypothetical protein
MIVQSTFNKDEILNTSPHYTDGRFHQPQTVFGQECEGLGYDYSDRLWQWDHDKSEAAAKTANASGAIPKSCRWYEEYLSAYFSRPIEIKHIVAGVNRSGHPYAVFGYKDIIDE